jgi:hypothetical protein
MFGVSLHHLVGGGKKRFRYSEAQALGGLEIHDHLKLGRKLNGKMGRLCAA